MSADALASWLLQTGVMITLLLGLVLIIRRPFAKVFGSTATYALWAIPFARLFMPGLTWPRALTPDWALPQSEAPLLIPAEFTFSGPMMFSNAPIAPDPVSLSGVAVLITVWLGVAAIWLGSQLWRQHIWLRDLEQHTQAPSALLLSEVQTACAEARIKRRPTVRLSAHNIGPCVTGLLRPVVILPDHFETDYTAEQRHFALIHELAHIRRGDLLAAMAALIFRALNWPNPLVHYAAIAFRTDQEAACDATVMRWIGASQHATQSYAKTIVQAASGSAAPLSPSPSSPYRAR